MLWFGDEFGPFLLHTDASGTVLEAPIPLPGVQSPQNPFLADPARVEPPGAAAASSRWRSAPTADALPDARGRADRTIRTRAGAWSTSSSLRDGRVHRPHLELPRRRGVPERRDRRHDRRRPEPLRADRARRLPGRRGAAEEDLPDRPAQDRTRTATSKKRARARPARDPRPGRHLTAGAARRVRRRRPVLVPAAVGREPRGARRRPPADRERQQLSRQRRPLARARPARTTPS